MKKKLKKFKTNQGKQEMVKLVREKKGKKDGQISVDYQNQKNKWR